MKKLLRRQRQRDAKDPKAALVELIGEVELPSFPSVISTAIEKIADSSVELREVADLVASDPGLTIRILRLANSPAFTPRSKIETLHHAVVMLGRNQLEAILMASGVNQALPTTPAPGFDPQTFWLQAATRAAAAGAMAATIDPSRRSEHFTAALLQDMAQPVLLHSNSSYADLTTAWTGTHAELAIAEIEQLGWSHAEVGSLMCRHWELPTFLTEAVTAHHDEANAEFAIVQWAALVGAAGQSSELAFEEALVRFGLAEPEVERLFAEATERAGEVAAILA